MKIPNEGFLAQVAMHQYQQIANTISMGLEMDILFSSA
jgi:hypothetical protein